MRDVGNRIARVAGLVAPALAAAALLGFAPGAMAQAPTAGDAVYKAVCAVCHASGVANAPRLGDAKAWAPLIAEGQDVLTAHAWVGVRAMPPRGGSPDLGLEAFSRAVAYMARAGGGEWKDPDAAMLARIRTEETKRREAMKSPR